MRQFRLLMILSVFIALTTSCIKRIPKTEKVDAQAIESMEGPKVIRDTIIKEVIVEKEIIDVDTEDIVQTQTVAKPAAVTRTPASRATGSKGDDRYDPNNSGFFDAYQQNYKGDPNRNLQPTRRVVTKDNSGDLERQKAELAKSLDKLEEVNKAEKERQAQLERERQALNQQIMQKAREEQQNQKPRGKTLDTDLLLNDRRR